MQHHLISLSGKSERLTLVLIFTIIFLTLSLPRLDLPWAWDDVSLVPFSRQNLDLAILADWFLEKESLNSDPGSYRPLQFLIIFSELKLFGEHPFPHILIQSAIMGFLGLIIYFIAKEIFHKELIAFIAAILYPLSKAAIIATWTALSKQPLAELFLAFGILAFLKYRKQKHLNWLILISVLTILGSMTREVVAALPVIVLTVTVMEKNKDWKLLLICAVLIVLSIYPSFLMNFMFGNISVPTIFERLPYDQESKLTSLYFQPEIPYGLFSFFPLPLLFIAIFSIFYYLLKNKKSLSRSLALLSCGGVVVFGLFTLMMYDRYERVDMFGFESTIIMPLSIFLAILIPTFFKNKLLVVWCFMTLIPFFILGEYSVFLKSSSIPWLLILLFWMTVFFEKNTGAHQKNIKKLNIILAIFVIAIITFQFFNIVQSYAGFSGIVLEFNKITEWSIQNILPGDMLISNNINAAQIAIYQNGQFDMGLLSNSCCGIKVVKNIEEFISSNPANNVYVLLTGNLDDILNTQPYCSSPACNDVKLKTNKLQFIKSWDINCGYPIINPLDSLPKYNVEQWRFVGPVDMQNQFVYKTELFWHQCKQQISMFKYDKKSELDLTLENWNIEPNASISKSEIIWTNSHGTAYLNLPPLDWANYSKITMEVNGKNSNLDFIFQIRSNDHGGSNWIQYDFNDNFAGINTVSIDLNLPTRTSGNFDPHDVRQIAILPNGDVNYTLEIRRIMIN